VQFVDIHHLDQSVDAERLNVVSFVDRVAAEQALTVAGNPSVLPALHTDVENSKRFMEMTGFHHPSGKFGRLVEVKVHCYSAYGESLTATRQL
jgi:hypothetical protein